MRFVKPLNLYQDLLKLRAVDRGRFLGLDVGDKYVGLAVSDFDNKVASPLSVLVRRKNNIGLMALDFKQLISKLSLSAFVVGYPYEYMQKNSENATQVKVFVDDLSKTGKLVDVKYTLWNECYTTKVCVSFYAKCLTISLWNELLLKPLNLHPVEAKTSSDKFAAVAILQAYLDFVNRYAVTEQSQ